MVLNLVLNGIRVVGQVEAGSSTGQGIVDKLHNK